MLNRDEFKRIAEFIELEINEKHSNYWSNITCGHSSVRFEQAYKKYTNGNSTLQSSEVVEVLNKLVGSLKWLMKEKEEEYKEYKEYKYAKKKYILKKEARIETVMECILIAQSALRDYVKTSMKVTRLPQSISPTPLN